MPILGFNRTPYFAINSIAGVTALFLIALVPSLSLSILLLMFFLVFMEIWLQSCIFLAFSKPSSNRFSLQLLFERDPEDIAWSDLLTEAVYSTHLRSKPEEGPNLISFIWGGARAAGLLSISNPIHTHIEYC